MRVLEKSVISLAAMAISKKRRRRGCLSFVFIIGFLLGFPFLWDRALDRFYAGRIYEPATLPRAETAIVFGARVYSSGRLSSMLRDRVQRAIDLYHAGQVDRLIVSGGVYDDGTSEPVAMKNYAIAQGVPEAAIVVDEGGLRTYDTCYRANAVYGVTEAVLVTQDFHLPRALFTCGALGINAHGLSADLRTYSERSMQFSESREFAAKLRALYDVVRRQPPSILSS